MWRHEYYTNLTRREKSFVYLNSLILARVSIDFMTFYVHVYEMQTIFEDVFFFSPLVFDVSCVFGE